MIINCVRNKELILLLVKRDFFLVYRRSVLGSAWIIISPLIGMISWFFLQKMHILHPGPTAIPYPAYLLAGTLIWGFFMSIFSATSSIISTYKILIIQTCFPHEIFFATQVLLKTIHFSLSFIMIICIFVFLQIPMDWKIIFFPFVLIPLVFSACAIGLVVSTFSVIPYDVNKLATGVFSLIMFITPVIYSPDAITNPMIRSLMYLNPLSYLICSARDIIFHGMLFHAARFWISSAGSLLFLVIAWRMFYVSEDRIIERSI